MKRILVIEREYGAGGNVIAEKTARRLGWKLLDDELTVRIARLAKVHPEDCRLREERVDPWLYRLAKVFWRGSHEHTVHLNDADIVDTDRLIGLTQQVVEEAAAVGECVIVGRAAPYFLRDRDDTACIFLYASRDVKFRRVLQEKPNAMEAAHLVDTVDEERAEFIRHYFKAEWPNRQLYDAMLNTEVGDEAVISAILHLMDAGKDRP